MKKYIFIGIILYFISSSEIAMMIPKLIFNKAKLELNKALSESIEIKKDSIDSPTPITPKIK